MSGNKKEFRKRFGERVRQIREAKHLTKTALADILNVERQDIYKIEQGIRNATLETISALASALDVSPVMLFDFNDQLGGLPKAQPKEPKKTTAKKKTAKAVKKTKK